MTTGVIPIVIYYQAGLLLSALICLAVAAKSFQFRHRPGGLWLGLVMVTATWWSLALLAKFSVTGIPDKIFWAKIEHWGIFGIIVFLPFFVLEFNGAQRFFKFPWWPFYLVVPAVGLALVWTNERHHLIWDSFTSVDIPGSNSVLFGQAIGLRLLEVYSHAVLVLTTLLLFRAALTYRHLHRRQAVLLLIAMAVPWLINVIYIFNLGPIPGMNFTPFGLAVTGVLLILTITRWRLLELAPIIARDRLIEEMQHGVIVLDEVRRIMDINPATRHMFNLSPDVISQEFAAHFAAFTPVLTQPNQRHEIEWPGPPPRIFSVSGTPLLDGEQQLVGYLVLCRDITAANQLQQEVWQRRLTLAVLEERQQLSNELHAKTGQVLEQITSLAQHVTHLLENEHHAAAAAVLAQLVEIARGNEANIDEFIHRRLPTPATPPDFFEALTQYTAHFSQSRNVQVALTHPTEPANGLLSPLAQIQLLRLIQEALLHLAGLTGPELLAEVIISAGPDEVQTVISSPGRLPHAATLEPLLRSRVDSVGGRIELRTDVAPTGYLIIHLPRRKAAPSKTIAAIRILLVDDQEIVLESFEELLTNQGLQVVGTAGSGPAAIEQARRLQPDVILMDIRLPGMSGLEATRRIKAEFPFVKVIMLTGSQNHKDLIESLRNGASGYLLKTLNPTHFYELLAGVLNGDTPLAPEMVGQVMTDVTQAEESISGVALLSSQQIDVLRLVTQGLTYREVADLLHLSQRTVQYHMDQIKEKLDVASRAEAVTQAIRLGLVVSAQ